MAEENTRFARMRKQAGYSQEDIANALNVTTRTIIYWEGGHHEPKLTIQQLKTVCRMLGIKSIEALPDNLFSAEPEKISCSGKSSLRK